MQISCTACGEETFVRREPVYDGFTKIGERFICTACGHEFENEDEVPFATTRKRPDVFSDSDRSKTLSIFDDDERQKNCRYCRHYVVNPFTQRCGLHDKEVQATDICFDFEKAEEEQTDEP